MSERTCGACGASQANATRQRLRTSDGSPVTYSRCVTCGLFNVDPLPTGDQIAASYSESYYGLGKTKFPAWLERIRERSARNAALRVHALRGCKPGEVMDVGCGSGSFLAALGGLGHTIVGSEYEGPALERARRVPAITLHESDLYEQSFAPNSFDVITLWHVLEHLPQPAETLSWCARWLKPDGLLVIEVPNVRSWQARVFGRNWLHLDPPRHLYQFTPFALEEMLKRNGFGVRSRETWSFQMGLFGAMQSAQNVVLAPRDLFYNLLLSRGSVRASPAKKLVAVVLAALLAVPALLLAAMEAVAGQGAVLRFFCAPSSVDARSGQIDSWEVPAQGMR